MQKFNLKKQILYSLIIFFIFLFFLEIFLRYTHAFGARISWSQPDDLLGYSYKPGKNYWYFEENDYPITGKFNKYGWRDKDWSLKKGKNEYRVAILGDSFVEAFQVEENKTFLSVVEKKLSKKLNRDIELMNFGRSGFTQTEELIILKQNVINFSPDLVIVFFLPNNDIQDINKATASDVVRPFYLQANSQLNLDQSFTEIKSYKMKEFINPFKQNSALVSLLVERFNLLKSKRNSTDNSKLEDYLTLCTSNPNKQFAENYKFNKLLIKKMAQVSKEKNIEFMLVSIDTPAYEKSKENSYKLLDKSFNANFFDEDLNSYSKQLQIEFLGLQSIFSKESRRTKKLFHWKHWNYNGHNLTAKALIPKLTKIIMQKDKTMGSK